MNAGYFSCHLKKSGSALLCLLTHFVMAGVLFSMALTLSLVSS